MLFFASLPIPYRFWAALETLACICQGKGYGASSMHHEVQAAARFLRSTPRCIVDVGANVGNYTQAWLDAAQTHDYSTLIECHLFEPSPTNLRTLRTRFSGIKGVHIYLLALSDVSAVLPLYANVPESALGSLATKSWFSAERDGPARRCSRRETGSTCGIRLGRAFSTHRDRYS